MRFTSVASVAQLLTEMRNTSWSRQRDPDIHTVPSAIRRAVTARVGGCQLQYFSANVLDPVVSPVVPVARQNIAVPVPAQLTE